MPCDPPSYEFSTDSDASTGWLAYFPRDYKPNYNNLKTKKELVTQRQAILNEKKKGEREAMVNEKKQGKRVLGLPAPKTWSDLGIKTWVPKDPKGKGKKQ